MCPPPCGPRRDSICCPSIVAQQRITKAEVDHIIYEDSFDCLLKYPSESRLQSYVGSIDNLHKILHDGVTKVKVVGSRSPYYVSGKHTIEMAGPCFPATVFIRIDNDRLG